MDIFEMLREHIRSQSSLARELGISPQALDGWRKRKQIPAERVLDIERITGLKVTRYMMRPDIFGAAPLPANEANSRLADIKKTELQETIARSVALG